MELREITFAKMLSDNAINNGYNEIILHKDKSLTYRDLNDAATGIATKLLRLGIQPEDRVALRSQNSAQWLAAFFGILKIGATAVLLESSLKTLDMLDYVKPTHVKCILHDSSFAGSSARKLTKLLNLPENAAFCIDYEDDDFVPPSRKEIEQIQTLTKEDDCHRPAIIVFTAGTDSEPKAVTLSQQSIASVALNQWEHIRGLQVSRLCLAMPLYTSFGLTFALQFIMPGAAVCLTDSYAPGDLLKCFEDNGIDAVAGNEALYDNLIAYPKLDANLAYRIHACYVVGGMSPSDKMIRAEFFFGNARFVCGYGQTETISYATLPNLMEPQTFRASNAGVPLPDTQIAIFAPQRGVLPEGEIGEIVIWGWNLMRGYDQVDAMHQPIDGSGWLHTGDVGYMQGGKLFPMGRLNGIIIKNGAPILPADIERVILNSMSIKEVKVLGLPNLETGESIEACVVLKPGYRLDTPYLRSELARVLPPNMIPAHFVDFEAFPKTASGNLNVKELKDTMFEKITAENIANNLNTGITITKLTIKNSDYMVMPIVQMLQTLSSDLGFSKNKLHQITHVAEEILGERIRNAYGCCEGNIDVDVVLLAKGMRINIRDNGPTYKLVDNPDDPTAKIIMSMVDDFASRGTADYTSSVSIDFNYDDKFDVNAFLLDHCQKP